MGTVDMMMKKLLIGLLITLQLLGTGAALAERLREVGTVIEVREDGNLIVETEPNVQITVNPRSAKNYTSGAFVPKMWINVLYDAPSPADVQTEIDAAVIFQATFSGHVTEIDAEASMVRLYANGGFNFYRVWVVLPETVDVSELLGKTIAVRPYREIGSWGDSPFEADEFVLLDSFTGILVAVESGIVTLDVQGKTVTALLTEETMMLTGYLATAIGAPAEVYYVSVDGEDIPDQVVAVDVNTGNG